LICFIIKNKIKIIIFIVILFLMMNQVLLKQQNFSANQEAFTLCHLVGRIGRFNAHTEPKLKARLLGSLAFT
jgi:hypothetical protein